LKLLEGYPQKTIFKSLDEAGVDWRIYMEDISAALFLSELREPENLARFRIYEDFKGLFFFFPFVFNHYLPTHSFLPSQRMLILAHCSLIPSSSLVTSPGLPIFLRTTNIPRTMSPKESDS
jgi:hypothetical protein